MKTPLLALIAVVTLSGSVYAGSKDAAIIKSPEGRCFEIKLPHDAAKPGPNDKVTIDRSALRKIEVRPIVCPTPKK